MKFQLPQNEVPLSSLSGDKATDEKLLLPYHYLQQVPGQKSRAKLAVAFNYWLDVNESKLEQINEIVEIFHNFGLLFDDVEDGSELRRGMPVAHRVYTVSATLVASYYAQAIALEKCFLLEHPEAIKVCVQEVLRIIRANGLDCYWRDNFACPDEEDYGKACDMASGHFMMAVKLMQLFSKNKQDFSKLIDTIGLFYQIRNDYLNLWSEKYMSENKTYCEDITEGKFSYPIIHAVKTSPNKEEILSILKQRTNDVTVKKRFMSLIEEAGSLEYTKRRLDELKSEMLFEIKKLGGNPLLEKYIAGISAF